MTEQNTSMTVDVNLLKNWLLQWEPSQCVGLTADAAPNLLPTCFRALALEAAFGINAECEAAIQNHQRPDTGLFNPLDIQRRHLSTHSATYIKHQSTYFAIHALDSMNTQPHFPVAPTKSFLDLSYLRGWLDAGPWANPWLHSNNIMFALSFLELASRQRPDVRCMRAFDFILDYLDERQDPETGLWQPDLGQDNKNAVYAAYHFFPFYFWRNRRPRYTERIIDTTLAIGDARGLFGGGACEDLDAVHTLVYINLIDNYRNSEVLQRLETAYWSLSDLQNDDGGFPNYLSRRYPPGLPRRVIEAIGFRPFLKRFIDPKPQYWKYSGWSKLSCANGTSDVWGSWFRPLAIKLIAEHIPKLPNPFSQGRFRRMPGLGWHDTKAITNAA